MSVDFLGTGFSFPVTAPAGPLQLVSGVEKIEQSIRLILATAPNERLMRPEFGCGIHDLVDQPNTDALRGMIAAQVEEAVARWEPRIDVIAVDVIGDDLASNRLWIDIEFRIRGNNATSNLVYPFFLNDEVGAGDGTTTGDPR